MKKKQSEIQLFTSTSNDPRFAPLLDPDSSPKKWEANSRPNGRPNGRPVGRPNCRPVVILGYPIRGNFFGEKGRKKWEKCWKNPKKENMKKKQSEIRLFTSTIQMSQESSRTDPYNPIFGYIKVLHFLSVFYGLN